MAKKPVGDEALGELASEQHGLVTRAQALKAGLSSSAIDRRLRNGAWDAPYVGVYRLRGSMKSDEQKTLAVCLHIGEGGVASHRSAAWLWQLDGFRDEAPRKVHVSAPRDRRVDLKGVEVFRRREELGHVMKDGVPTTFLTQTISDLAGILKEEALEIALDSAGRGKLEFIEELAEFLGESKGYGRTGNGVLGDLVRARRGGNATGSSFETKVLRRIRAAKLPAPVVQHPMFERGGDHPFMHVDFAWVAQKVALLPDGVGTHMSKKQFEKDAVQRAKLTAMGWRHVNLTPDLVAEGTWLKAISSLLSGK